MPRLICLGRIVAAVFGTIAITAMFLVWLYL